MNGERDLAVLLRTMHPVLLPGRYVFVSVEQPPAGAEPVAWVREVEGIGLVLPQADADAAGLEYTFVAAMITLRVHSALDAVGLTAAVAGALADEGISCNVIAGFHHDHLFVPADRAHVALEVLRGLSAQAG